MNIHSKIVIPTTAFSQIIDNEMVILDTQSENYFGLDSVGSVMWKELQKNPSLKALKVTLLAMYDVDEKILKNDIKTFVEKLLESGLVKVEDN